MGLKDYKYKQLIIGNERDINDYYKDITNNYLIEDKDYLHNTYYDGKPYQYIKKYDNYIVIEYHILEGGMISMGGSPIDDMDERLTRITTKYPNMYFVIELDYERGDYGCFICKNDDGFWVEDKMINEDILPNYQILLFDEKSVFFQVKRILLKRFTL